MIRDKVVWAADVGRPGTLSCTGGRYDQVARSGSRTAAGTVPSVNEPQPDQSPAGPAKVTTYIAGRVPGVSYRDGMAHSPVESEPEAAAKPAGSPSPEKAGIARPPAAPLRRRASPPPGRPPSSRPAGGGLSGRRIARWLGGFIVVILAALIVLGMIAWSRIDKVDAIPDDHGAAVSEGRVYLLVGSDSREELTPEERAELGTGSTAGRRTDTIMLLHLPTSGRPALISVPRDSLVEIPGHGDERINAAYAFGGAPLLVQTLENATGVAIDDYVEIGFGGFASVVDALGGVDVCLDEPVQDDKAHIDLPAGCQVLDGVNALGYARARDFDPTADLGRVQRQRELIGSIAGTALSPGTLLNPVSLTRTALAGGDALTLDEQTGPIDLARFALGMRRVTSGAGDTLTVPLGRVGNTVDWDEEQAGVLWSALRDGTEVPAELLTDQ
jgi:LCP family protein required for cell wall assembly